MAFGLGNILGVVSGISSLLGGNKAQSKANKMAAGQLTIQRDLYKLIKEMGPYFQGLMPDLAGDAEDAAKYARSYDPGKDTEDALRSYDVGARESVNRDLASTTVPLALRGFNAGTGDSDRAAKTSDVLARRATHRADYASHLKQNEPLRKMQIGGMASDRVARAFQLFDPTNRAQGVSQGLAQLGGQYQQQAASYDPMGSIMSIAGGIKGFMPAGKKMPWQYYNGGEAAS